jgi:uncharacterized protein (DUF983 family)
MTLVLQTNPKRNLWQSIKRGLAGRCPHCGQGHLFRRFLKVADHCEACGEAYHHHRADDLPAYLSIVIVGHIVVFLMLEFEMESGFSPMTYLLTLIPLAVVLTLVLLQPIKGAVVGLQWANYMHGFDPTTRDPALPDDDGI